MGSRRTHAALAIGLVLTVTVPLLLAGDARSAARETAGPPSPADPAPPDARASVPEPAAPPVAAPAAPQPPDPPQRPAPSEAELTDRVRAAVDVDPAAALRLADDCDRVFDGGTLADERAYLRMRALVHLGRIGDARSEAERFFERFPGSAHGERAYRLTGVHPRPPPPYDPGSR